MADTNLENRDYNTLSPEEKNQLDAQRREAEIQAIADARKRATDVRSEFGTSDLTPSDTARGGFDAAAEERARNPNIIESTFNPEQVAKNKQFYDIQSGMYTLNLPSDYAQQQRQLATQMGTRQAPELDLKNYNQDRAAMMQALDYQNANRDQFISAGYEGQKALGTASQYAAKNAARGTNLSQMADQNRSAQEIAGRVGAQAASEENATRNRLIQGAAQARAQDQQVVKAWQNAQLTQRSMNDAMVKFYLTQGMDYEQAQAQAQLEAAKLFASRKGLGQQAQGNALQTAATVIGTIIAL